MPTKGPFLILRLTYWVWKGSSVNFVSEELPLLPATTTPLPTTLQPHSGQQWRQLGEKNDKLGFSTARERGLTWYPYGAA